MKQDALLYDELEDNVVQCHLCAHQCVIQPGKKGICQVRVNDDGRLKTLVYGNLIAKHVDPIEKKPLYHFYPGSLAYSIAAPGCNFRCEWCQNWQISQMPRKMTIPAVDRTSPEDVVRAAVSSDCRSIAYTYTEPTVFFEFSFDTAKLAHQEGIKNIYVSNGFMSDAMLELFSPYLDAANIDIKSFEEDTYRRLMGGHLSPVLESCQKMKAMGVWLEITTLVVPGVNDDLDEMKALAAFIHDKLGAETPWHLSRFYPQYKMNHTSPTDENLLSRLRDIGHSLGLHYIYLGNISARTETHCKQCGHALIIRRGYTVQMSGLDATGHCRVCGTVLDGVGLERQ